MRRLIPVLLVLLALTGCFKYETTAVIDEQGLVSGSVVIGYGPEAIDFGRQAGRDPLGELERFLRSNAAKVSRGNASVRPYAAGSIRGFRTTFVKVSPSDFTRLMLHEDLDTGATGAVDYRLTKTGDILTFSAQLRAKKEQIKIPPEAFKDADVRVSLTFPGEIVTTNGAVSGRTVTWRPNPATLPRLTATAKLPLTSQPTTAATPAATATGEPTAQATSEPATPSGSHAVLLVILVVVALLVAAAAVLFLVRRLRTP